MDLARRIRSLRLWQGATLEHVAQQAGLTRSYLCKIESGKAVPSLAALENLAQALGISAATILEHQTAQGVSLTRSDEVDAGLQVSDQGYRFFSFATGFADKRMQPLLFVARKGEVQHGRSLHHPGQEWIYVLSGRMVYRVGGRQEVLGPGDSLFFDSENDHDLEPLTQEVRWLAVFVAPINQSRSRAVRSEHPARKLKPRAIKTVRPARSATRSSTRTSRKLP